MVRLALAALLLAGSARAESFEERLEKKLQAPFLKHAPWVLDYDEARKLAREKGRVVFAYFTRSFAP
jgi:hypothetical protein